MPVKPSMILQLLTRGFSKHDLDDSDNLRAKEAAMLGLPYESVFAKEVQIGDRTVDGSQLKWSVFHDFPAGKSWNTLHLSWLPSMARSPIWTSLAKMLE